MDMAWLWPETMNLAKAWLPTIDPFGAGPLTVLFITNYCILYLGIRRADKRAWAKLAQLDRMVLSAIISLVSFTIFFITTGVFLSLAIFMVMVVGVVFAVILGMDFTQQVVGVLIGNFIVPFSMLSSFVQTIRMTSMVVEYYHMRWDKIIDQGIFTHGLNEIFQGRDAREKLEIWAALTVFSLFLMTSTFLSLFYLSRIFNLGALIRLTDAVPKVFGMTPILVLVLVATLAYLIMRFTIGMKWEHKR